MGFSLFGHSAPAPAIDPDTGLPNIPVGLLETLGAGLVHGGTWAEAQNSARAAKLQKISDEMALSRAQRLSSIYGAMPDQDFLYSSLNPQEYAKAGSQNMLPQILNPDQTLIQGGGPGHMWGAQYTGPGKVDVTANGIINNDLYGPQGTVTGYTTAGGQVFATPPRINMPNAPSATPTSGWLYNGQQPPPQAPTPVSAPPQAQAPQPAAQPPQPAPGAPPLVPQLNQPTPAASAPSAPPAPPALTPQTAFGVVNKFAPGSQLTSGYRTPQRNAQVGGVPNSMHTRGGGQAIDFTLPQGVTADQVRAELTRQGQPVSEFLNEGNHVHWGWGAKGAAAPQATAQLTPVSNPQGRQPNGGFVMDGGATAVAGHKPGTALTPQERAAAQIPKFDPRPYVWQADGNPAPLNPQYGPNDVRQQRTEFYKRPEYTEYANTVNGVNTIENLLHAFVKNGSVVDQGALDLTIRNMTGLSARNQNVVNFTEHLGLPDRLVGAITQKFGNGYLTPSVLMDMRTMARAYAEGHRATAQQALADEAKWAKGQGQEFGGELPTLAAAEPVSWLDGKGQRHDPTPVRVRTPAEAMQLAEGTPIILPDGRIGKVPPHPKR